MRDTIGYLTLPDGTIVLFCKAPYAVIVNFGGVRRAANPFFSQAEDFMRWEMMKAMRGLTEG